MSNKSIHPTWKKKVSLLNFIATVTVTFCILVSVTPEICSDRHGDDGDPREEIAAGAGILAAVAGGIAWAGGAAAATATAPAWVPLAGGIAAGAGIVGAGVALWDVLDGPEDNCYDCDGSGCDTCDPPDDDDCNNCDGRGCSACGN